MTTAAETRLELAQGLVHRFEMESMALHKTQRDWLTKEIAGLLRATEPAGAGAREAMEQLNAVAPAVENLARHQEQCDMDGVMVKVSRQALDETLNAVNAAVIALATLPSPPSSDAGARELPALPDNDADFTPDLARKIIAKYRALLRASPSSASMEGLARLSASEVACYRWPEDMTEHRAMRAAFCDGAIHITTLASSPMGGRWEERAIAVLNKMLEAYDTGNLQMNSNEIGEPENNIPHYPWHEELIWNARQAVALSRPVRPPIENGGLSATPHEGNGPCE
jgi:hypothetical protein